MSVFSEIERLEGAKNALAASIEGKGVTVPEGTKIDGMAALVDQISTGGGTDFYIDDADYMFYGGARMGIYDEIKARFRNVKSSRFAFWRNGEIVNFYASEMNYGRPTGIAQMFYYCTSLKKVDFSGVDCSAIQFVGSAFKYCYELEEILNFACCMAEDDRDIFPDSSGAAPGTYKLRRLTFQDAASYTVPTIKDYIWVRGCSFDRAGAVEMFNSLPDISTLSGIKPNINIGNNPCTTDGTLADEDVAIATEKGWSVIK